MKHYQYLEFSANAPTASEEWTDFIPEDDFYDVLDLYHDAGVGTEPISTGDDLGIDIYRLDYSSYPHTPPKDVRFLMVREIKEQ